MMRYDFYHWIRSRKAFFLFFIISICSLVATLSTYYAKDIINTLGTTGAKVMLQEVHWRDILSSYFKITSQICLFTAIYLTSSECQLGRVESEKLFYQTRMKRGGKVLLSKVLTSAIINLISICFGGILALYTTWAMYSTMNFEKTLLALTIQSLSFVCFTLLGNAISCYLTPFVSAMILEVLILFSSLIEQLRFLGHWSPFTLLTPNNILNNLEIKDLSMKLISSFLIILISLSLIWFKPVKQH
ncbi:hypothetical protein [Streptococcus saliviloxodontae]|uniref:ABC transporter permease n=1 Tax=Streptococcus saliviloxodontae TaxID=1349416 RepID=A0ABS2PJP9_9STRE|nr:hypothetical protein [Streptococcus saliviloxodontae]MBM7635659.1 hypothetical protein [Streptococcus saliviloxodontae]